MKWSTLAALMALEAVLLCAGISDASRNSSGTFSLFTPGNPVVTGTVGNATWANNTLNDIATSLTDSLDRNGKGGMLAALRGTDGTLAAPALSFTSETGSGLFRNGASDVRMSISGSLRENWTSAGVAVTGTLSSTSDFSVNTNKFTVTASNGNTAVAGTLGVTGAATLSTAVASTSLAVGGANPGTWTTNGSDVFINSGAASQTITLRPNGAGSGTGEVSTSTAGLKIGSSGTAISASIRGTVSWTPGLLVAGACSTNTITATGAAAGADVACNGGGGLVGQLYFGCYVTANTCNIQWCNPPNATSSSTPPSATYSCRVFNP